MRIRCVQNEKNFVIIKMLDDNAAIDPSVVMYNHKLVLISYEDAIASIDSTGDVSIIKSWHLLSRTSKSHLYDFIASYMEIRRSEVNQLAVQNLVRDGKIILSSDVTLM